MTERKTLNTALLLAACLVAGVVWMPAACAAQPAEAASQEEKADPPTPQRPKTIRQLLADVLAGKHPVADVRMDVMWETKGHVVIHGSGVGVWDRRVQFRLSREQVLSIAGAFDRHRVVGRSGIIGKTLRPGEEGVPAQVIGNVKLSIGDQRSHIVQLDRGTKLQPLEDLADEVINTCRGLAKDGVTVKDAKDALAKLSAGELDPAVTRLVVNRLPIENGPNGYILIIKGHAVRIRSRDRNGMGPESSHRLSPQQYAGLIRLLQGTHAYGLPARLYAPAYVDVQFDVLDQQLSLQGRENFEGIGPRTLGGAQQRFEQLITGIDALAASLMEAQGQPEAKTPDKAPTERDQPEVGDLPEGHGVVVGRVVDAAGNPVANASVSILPTGNPGRRVRREVVLPNGAKVTRREPENLQRTRTGADGRFRFVIAAGDRIVVNVQSTAGGAGKNGIEVQAGKATDAGDLAVRKGGM